MIAIDDVQLTPKRVPVGGNFLLRVLAHYMDGDDEGLKITTQDVPLEWEYAPDNMLVYAPLDLAGPDAARVIHAVISMGAEPYLQAPGGLTLGDAPVTNLGIGCLYGLAPGGGYAIYADVSNLASASPDLADVIAGTLEAYSQATLYMLEV